MIFEVFVLNIIGLALGLVALRYDRDIADALTYFPYWIGELIRQRYLGWRPRIQPPSRERFETWLKFSRFWAWFMIVVGFFNLVTFLIVGVWSKFLAACRAFAPPNSGTLEKPLCGYHPKNSTLMAAWVVQLD